MGSIGPETDAQEIAIIGAGFSGIYELHKLKDAGFNVRLYEAGEGVGGIWYWNCYPGARVDTPVPTYQLTSDDTWTDWNWSQRFPDYSELRTYFQHLVKVWGLEDLITFNTRVESMRWDDQSRHWDLEMRSYGTVQTKSASAVVVCTGFGSKPYIPPWKGLDTFKGNLLHTGLWPQGGVPLEGKRVAIIGTGASGVQLIQETAKVVKHLTVFQRTPNTALPMNNPQYDKAKNDVWKKTYAETKEIILKTFAGFDYEFRKENANTLTPEVRAAFYKTLLESGGLHFWLGTFQDVLFDEEANAEAYEYWRQSVIPRIKDRRNQEILAPKVAPHPFGTKRISLERQYFEVFNQDNVDLVDLVENPISEITATGIKTKDGILHEVDVIVAATGFDSVTGGITAIDIRGTDPKQSIKDRWSQGCYTLFGLTTSGFPNMFMMYGPQAPTAFATGPSSAECQGEWITACLTHMRDHHITKIDATREAEKDWRDHTLEMGGKGLFPKAKGWYYGDNIPGKPREALNYMAGLPLYREKIWESANNGYRGFELTA
jgi:cation diffusion facilitator CzcD-associated flavoprotein CzcO